MYRHGKYTKRLGPIGKSKRFIKRRWQWFKELSWKKKILLIGGPIVAFLIVVPAITYAYYYNDIGNQERLLNRNNTGVVLLDKNGERFYTTPGARAEKRELVPLDKIADTTEKALIASEDKDFYEHSGFDIFGILRALYGNLVARDITGGGSTLTQQLAKNTLLTEKQTILRKYQELVLAVAIENRYSKDEILTMYLNSVYYGENAFGIEDAAKNYFNKKPSELTLQESAMLIGVLPAPTAYSPISGDEELAKERQNTVLTRMVRNGFITEAEKTSAFEKTIAYSEGSPGISNDAPHFTEMVLSELYEKYGEERVTRSGFRVTTTLDLNLQKKANAAVDSNMDFIEANGGSNASLVAMDPKTGGITALVGSADYDNDEFGKVNMATTARQPGSSFKSIYYADALASGKVTPTTVLEDKRTDFGGGYTPQNADRRFRGNVTVRQALNWSLNIPAIKVMQRDGIDNAVNAAKRLGITTLDTSKDYGLSLALGSAEVPLTEMTNAYATFANEGERHDASKIGSIKDKYDNTIFTQQRKTTRAISTQGSFLLSNILSDNQTRSSVFGSSLSVTGTDGRTKTAAVKTGTTDDSRDAWTIGYTPDVAVGVWVGNNDNEIMANGGSSMAGPIWRNMMGQAIGSSSPSFTQPSGVTKATVCTTIGNRSDVFLSTNVPRKCETKQSEPKEEKPEKKEEVAACTVPGKENLKANDPKCAVDQCEVEGLEDIAANDPRCVEPEDDTTTDSDGDGVVDADDRCPDRPGTTANNGCPATGPGQGAGPGRNQSQTPTRRLPGTDG